MSNSMCLSFILFYFFNIYIFYFFKVFGCVGSSLWNAGSFVVALRLLSISGLRVFSLQLWRAGSRVRGLCSLWHVGSLVEVCGLSSCGMRAQLLCGMWDLSSQTKDRAHVPFIGRWILYHWTTREIPMWSFFKVKKL